MNERWKSSVRRQSRLAILAACLLLLPGAAPWPPDPEAEASASGGAGAEKAAAGGEEVRLGIYRGTVTDRRSGKPVPEALVIFINEASGESFQTSTGKDGKYEIDLPEGEYIVDIQVGRKVYRSSGSFREEATGRRWVMDFTVGSKLTEKDLKIRTTSEDVKLIPTEPRPPLEPSRKRAEFLIFLGGLLGVAALAN